MTLEPTGWHYVQGNEKRGPISLDEIRQLIEAGTLVARSHVWHKSFGAHWRKVQDIPELSKGAAPTPAAKPAAPAPKPALTLKPRLPTPAAPVAKPQGATPAVPAAKPQGPALGAPAGVPAGAPAAGTPAPADAAPAAEEDEEAKKKKADALDEALEAELTARGQVEAERRKFLIRVAVGVAVVVGGIGLAIGIRAYLKHKRLYGDPLVIAYGEFADLCYSKKFDEALAYCEDGSTAARALVKEKTDWEDPVKVRIRRHSGIGVSKDVLFSRYKLLEKTMRDDETGVVLKIERTLRTFRGDTPAQQLLLSEHTVIMVPVDEDWKIRSITVFEKGAFEPYSRKPLD
ncbi:MAG: DUF4339 domain-containing protein [Kiritimatiellae bacterium]|nr:DUF4339 domain-containing protein [Kiritimatiellia bacterium]